MSSGLNKNCLTDKTILITGAGSGIGKATAITYASHGATVILLGKTSSKLEKVYDEIEKLGYPTPSISLMDLLLADANDYQELIDNLIKEFNQLDGLLLNAAILGDRSPIEQYDVQKWLETIHINLTSQFILVKTLLPALKKSDNASVVFTSSGVGKTGKAFWGAYSVSKFGVEGLCQILAEEFDNDSSVRFNCINPGAVRTKMRKEAYPLENPDDLPTPDMIMEKYLWLMSNASKNISGKSFDCQQ
jgi:NAD(P)-dependent dehydrogenase (short-subunit alcohol dehydrogenase family)|tara:strand:+ start:2562 stop:3302 length:741 start_codon:yes stop_codon:yes gene_type:complete